MSVWANRFRVIAALGQGGMGAVYEAEDLETGQRVALKIAHGSLLTDAEALRRFVREAQLLAELDHPNVVRIVATGEHSGRPFMVMELVPGETLSDRIRRGALTPAEFAPILRAVAFGVQAAHRAGIIHRDLKPSNILLPEDGADAKVADFGIAKDLDGSRLTNTGGLVGTPRYISYELFKGAGPDVRSDVYALGVVAFEALSAHTRIPRGMDPFRAIAAGTFVPLGAVVAVPAAIEAVVARAMARDPDARYASMVAFAEAFEDALASAGPSELSRAVDPWAPNPDTPPTLLNAAPTEDTTVPTFSDDPTPVG